MSTIAKLLIPQIARSAPSASASKVDDVSAQTPIAHDPTVLLVLDRQPGWLHCRLPGRPDGTTGWISSNGVQLSEIDCSITVDCSARQTRISRNGQQVASYRCVIGAPATPTPRGNFFVTEKVLQPSGSDIGPWVLALNGYSNVLQDFDGGPGQIALHGQLGALAVPLGSAASHGCVRFDPRTDQWLANNVPVGTPVTISD
jgi:hypothetical protein